MRPPIGFPSPRLLAVLAVLGLTSTLVETLVTVPEKIKAIPTSNEHRTVSDKSDTQPDSASIKSIEKKAMVPHSHFYSQRGLFVECGNPDFVPDIEPYVSPSFPLVVIAHWTNWADVRDQHGPVEMKFRIREQQRFCRTCTCTNQAVLVRTPKYPGDRRNIRSVPCRSEILANLCVMNYGCYCTAELVQPEPYPDASEADHQRSLDTLPATVRTRDSNIGYRWRVGGRDLGFADTGLGTPGDVEFWPQYAQYLTEMRNRPEEENLLEPGHELLGADGSGQLNSGLRNMERLYYDPNRYFGPDWKPGPGGSGSGIH
ncbi:hypothetical protein TWF730_007613 [Orbilia blumenaviensis]|uniref:Uncharacterized protein n=1 Tax=Orbilia blumenaviensis TaxID=1796055 RepID=A0AAV9VB71_9PEZI